MGTILIYTYPMYLKYQPAGTKQRAQDVERTRGAARASDARGSDVTRASEAHGSEVTLTDLKTGATARVVSVAPADGAAPKELGRRLAELGFLPGEAVRVVARGLLAREPIAVRIGTGTFALRLFEAACIRVCPEPTPAG
jgi:ferrous iron transport protein A